MPLLLVATVIFFSRRCGEIERELQHALGAVPREDRLLHHELALGAFEHRAADRRILAFGVLAHDHEVDVAGLAARERRGHAVEQTRRAQVDVLVELAAELEQRPPQRDVIGHGGGPADRAEQDRVGAFELRLPVVGHHLAVLRVVVAARPFDVLVFAASMPKRLLDGVERAQAFGHDFLADAVAGNDGDSICLRHASLLFGFSMTMQCIPAWIATTIRLLVKPLCTNREESAEPRASGESDFARLACLKRTPQRWCCEKSVSSG